MIGTALKRSNNVYGTTHLAERPSASSGIKRHVITIRSMFDFVTCRRNQAQGQEGQKFDQGAIPRLIDSVLLNVMVSSALGYIQREDLDAKPSFILRGTGPSALEPTRRIRPSRDDIIMRSIRVELTRIHVGWQRRLRCSRSQRDVHPARRPTLMYRQAHLEDIFNLAKVATTASANRERQTSCAQEAPLKWESKEASMKKLLAGAYRATTERKGHPNTLHRP